KLKDSKYSSHEDIARMAQVFDKTTKLSFRSEADTGYIQFGSLRDKDLSVGINRGQMKIPGDIMRLFFAPSVQEILDAVQEQMKEADVPVSAVFLVGGFAASDYLFSTLQKTLDQLKLTFSRPDGFVNKAVADGAVSFYLDHMVSARVARFTYGVECSTSYMPSDPEHRKRSHTLYTDVAGYQLVPDHFDHILVKGHRVNEETEFRRTYHRLALKAEPLRDISVEILHYRGHDKAPKWLDVDPSA
ncbi:hypothetical protein V5O48_007863, partial [Marasmius crinis-equi]